MIHIIGAIYVSMLKVREHHSMDGNTMENLSKQELWKAMHEPTEKNCSNCKNHHFLMNSWECRKTITGYGCVGYAYALWEYNNESE